MHSFVVLVAYVAASFPILFLSLPAAKADQSGETAISKVGSDVAEKTREPATQPKDAPALTPVAGAVSDQKNPTSEAERISQLQRSIEDARNRLQELKGDLNNPESEFAKAERAFIQLDKELSQTTKSRESSPEGREQTAEPRQVDFEELQKKRELAKERFDLAIQERKATQESVRTLAEKLHKDQQQLDGLLGNAKKQDNPPKTVASATSETARPPEGKTPVDKKPTTQASAKSTPPALPPQSAAPQDIATAASGAPSALPPEATKGQKPSGASAARTAMDEAANEEIEEAAAAAEQKDNEAHAAEEKARSVAAQMALLQKNIASEQTLRDTARKQSDNAERTLQGLYKELHRKTRSGAYPDQLRAQVNEVESRVQQAPAEVRRADTRLGELQTELRDRQAEHAKLQRDGERKRTEAEKAQARVESLRNPFAPRNVLQWLLVHSPRLLAIALAMAGFLWLSRVLEKRLVSLMAKRGERGTPDERQNRARTLLGVFHNVATLIIVGGGSMMVLEEIGIPVGPLLGGAAVLGLAIAFGAQSLIKDYFTGFMVILEQQYSIDDVIKIGDIAGQVEKITLRMTVLRDLEGRVHFIPHGQIATVTNFTHNWSRALFDIPVAYKENVDQVIDILTDLGRELQRDPEYADLILEELTMLGVDAFDDSAVVIKFYIKTKPLTQWTVKRELLRRIKRKFDAMQIEIPFPHRTVYHHHNIENEDASCIEPREHRNQRAA